MALTMPSFLDSGVIVLLALLLFGPKKLPVLARQLGKLMADFRRASNEFRTQMEEELRISEQADRQKQIAAMEAAAPPTPSIEATSHVSAPEPTTPVSETDPETEPDAQASSSSSQPEPEPTDPEPLPIATSGDLSIMPPPTGLPVARSSSLSPLLDSIPAVADPENSIAPPHHASAPAAVETETLHG
jgi:sec-independent protein translocase protein TatB